jgi:hypothetical protein
LSPSSVRPSAIRLHTWRAIACPRSVIPYLPLVDLVRGDAGRDRRRSSEAVTEGRGRLRRSGSTSRRPRPAAPRARRKAGTERLVGPERRPQARVFEILRR